MKPENQLKVIALAFCSIIIMVAFITFVSIKTTEAVAGHGGGEHGASNHKTEHKTDTHKEEHKTETHKEEHKTEAHKEEHKTEAPKEEHKTEAPKEEHKTEAPKEEHKTEAIAPAGDIEAGKAVFLKAAHMCSTCHKVTDEKSVGPGLAGLGKTAATRKDGMSAEDYIKESIENPTAFIVDGFAPAMPPKLNGTMSKDEYKNLVAYLLSL